MSNPEESPYICWIDLETTGNKPTDTILEFGGAITDRALNVLSTISLTGSLFGGIEHWEDVVVQMHTENGLIKDAMANGLPLDEMDEKAVAWISQFTKGDHIPLAGSGVSHFDRRYIIKDLPKFNKFITYWSYDVGVIRRTLQLFGIEVPNADMRIYKTHRALDDILVHIDEMRLYRQAMLKMAEMWGYMVVSAD